MLLPRETASASTRAATTLIGLHPNLRPSIGVAYEALAQRWGGPRTKAVDDVQNGGHRGLHTIALSKAWSRRYLY
jgi:hypothetical protein